MKFHNTQLSLGGKINWGKKKKIEQGLGLLQTCD